MNFQIAVGWVSLMTAGYFIAAALGMNNTGIALTCLFLPLGIHCIVAGIINGKAKEIEKGAYGFKVKEAE